MSTVLITTLAAELPEKTNWRDLTLAADQWSSERVSQCGPGAELARRIFAEELQEKFAAWLAVSDLTDVVFLNSVFDRESQQKPGQPGACSLVEAFLLAIGVDPVELVEAQVQRIHVGGR
jgi:hypothetical protein